ncbi:MAG: hypothetical protein IPI84_01515 [Holophagaceae bacterium]|nr:hypothetical protein [Holophagaceae bacterium]
MRLDSLLFGETAGRIVVSVSPEAESAWPPLRHPSGAPLPDGATGGTRSPLRSTASPAGRDAAELKALHAEALEQALT